MYAVVGAEGIELERAGVERAKAAICARAIEGRANPAPTTADLSATDPPPKPAKTPTEKKSTAGAKESALWADIVPHLRTVFPNDQPSPTQNQSFHAVKNWLHDKHKTMGDSTIREGIKRHFPEWTSRP
jgi:hypothetical protein